jgi:hypothetical protein
MPQKYNIFSNVFTLFLRCKKCERFCEHFEQVCIFLYHFFRSTYKSMIYKINYCVIVCYRSQQRQKKAVKTAFFVSQLGLLSLFLNYYSSNTYCCSQKRCEQICEHLYASVNKLRVEFESLRDRCLIDCFFLHRYGLV